MIVEEKFMKSRKFLFLALITKCTSTTMNMADLLLVIKVNDKKEVS